MLGALQITLNERTDERLPFHGHFGMPKLKVNPAYPYHQQIQPHFLSDLYLKNVTWDSTCAGQGHFPQETILGRKRQEKH